jgi:hypothetical protein
MISSFHGKLDSPPMVASTTTAASSSQPKYVTILLISLFTADLKDARVSVSTHSPFLTCSS